MEDITVEPRGRRRLYGDPGPAVKVKNMSRNPAKSVRCHSSATALVCILNKQHVTLPVNARSTFNCDATQVAPLSQPPSTYHLPWLLSLIYKDWGYLTAELNTQKQNHMSIFYIIMH